MTAMHPAVAVLVLGAAVSAQQMPRTIRGEVRGSQGVALGISTGIVAAGIDPATGRLRGGADMRRERAIVTS